MPCSESPLPSWAFRLVWKRPKSVQQWRRCESWPGRTGSFHCKETSLRKSIGLSCHSSAAITVSVADSIQAMSRHCKRTLTSALNVSTGALRQDGYRLAQQSARSGWNPSLGTRCTCGASLSLLFLSDKWHRPRMTQEHGRSPL